MTFNGKFQYVNNRPKGPFPSLSFSTEPHTRLRHFVEFAISELAAKCPGAITDGLVRVDVFQNCKKELIVNEFESLEACFYNQKCQHTTTTQLVCYWEAKIKNLVNSFF